MRINRWPFLLCLLPGVMWTVTAEAAVNTDITDVFLQAMDGPETVKPVTPTTHSRAVAQIPAIKPTTAVKPTQSLEIEKHSIATSVTIPAESVDTTAPASISSKMISAVEKNLSFPLLTHWVEKGLTRMFDKMPQSEETKTSTVAQARALLPEVQNHAAVHAENGVYRNPFYLLLSNWVEHGEDIAFAAMPDSSEPVEFAKIQVPVATKTTEKAGATIDENSVYPAPALENWLKSETTQLLAELPKISHVITPEPAVRVPSASPQPKVMISTAQVVETGYLSLENWMENELAYVFASWPKARPVLATASFRSIQLPVPDLSRLIAKNALVEKNKGILATMAHTPLQPAQSMAFTLTANVPNLSVLPQTLIAAVQNQRELAQMALSQLHPAKFITFNLAASIPASPALPTVLTNSARTEQVLAANMLEAQNQAILARMANTQLRPALASSFGLAAEIPEPPSLPPIIAKLVAAEQEAETEAAQRNLKTLAIMERLHLQPAASSSFVLAAEIPEAPPSLPPMIASLVAAEQADEKAAMQENLASLAVMAQKQLRPAQPTLFHLYASLPTPHAVSIPAAAAGNSVPSLQVAAITEQAGVRDPQVDQQLETLHKQNTDLTTRLHDLNHQVALLQLAMVQSNSLTSALNPGLWGKESNAAATPVPKSDNTASPQEVPLAGKMDAVQIHPAESKMFTLEPVHGSSMVHSLASQVEKRQMAPLLPPPPQYISIKKYLALQSSIPSQTSAPIIPDIPLATKPLPLGESSQLQQKIGQVGSDLQAETAELKQKLVIGSRQVVAAVSQTSRSQSTLLKNFLSEPDFILALAIGLILAALGLLVWLLWPWLRPQGSSEDAEEKAGADLTTEVVEKGEDFLVVKRKEPVFSSVQEITELPMVPAEQITDMDKEELALEESQEESQTLNLQQDLPEAQAVDEQFVGSALHHEQAEEILAATLPVEEDFLVKDSPAPQLSEQPLEINEEQILELIESEFMDNLEDITPQELPAATPVHQPVFEGNDEEDDYDFMDSKDAIPIKLDLARAYLEMEDFAAVEQTLQSVLQKGSPEQQEEAQLLLEQARLAVVEN